MGVDERLTGSMVDLTSSGQKSGGNTAREGLVTSEERADSEDTAALMAGCSYPRGREPI